MFVDGKQVYSFKIFTTATTEYKKIVGSFRWLSFGSYGSNNSLKSFTLDNELKIKRKHDFSGKTKLFMIKEKVHNEMVNIVYIHSSLVSLIEEEQSPLNYDTYSVNRYRLLFQGLECETLKGDEDKLIKLGIGFAKTGETTQTEKQKAHKKIEDLFRDKFGNKVPTYYLSDLAKFFKKNSRLANKAEIK
jgi:hypothetical protein